MGVPIVIRRLISILACICLSGGLAACGGNAGAPATAPLPPAAPAAVEPAPAPPAPDVFSTLALPPVPAASTSKTVRVKSAAATYQLAQTGGMLPVVTVPGGKPVGDRVTIGFNTGSKVTMPGGYLAEFVATPKTSVSFPSLPSASIDISDYLSSNHATALRILKRANVHFYAGVLDSAGHLVSAGPLPVSGTVITVPSAAVPLSMSGGKQYHIGIHIGPLASAMKTSVSSLALTGTGKANAQTFTVSGGTKPYSAAGFSKSIVTVVRSSQDPSVFIVTPVAAGTTTIAVHDASGQIVNVKAGVTTLSGGIQ